MMTSEPLRFSPDSGLLSAEEAQTVDELCQAFEGIQRTTAQDYGHAVRSVHAKAHAVLEGLLTVDDDLPPELAQGLFARPGNHKVYMRISTNAGDILPDAVSLPRGLAIKVLDVEGERLPDAEGATQDFILVNSKVFQAKTASDFLGALKLLARTTDRAEAAKVALSSILRGVNTALKAVGVESATVAALGGAPNVDPLGETYYSVTPFRYGDYIAKFSVAPITPALTELTGSRIDANGQPDALRKTIQQEMLDIEGVWEFRVQLCRDLARQPIEDSTVAWNEDESPFQRVGVITAHPQDSWEQADAIDEKMRFSVWTGLAAHQPLGNINRARKATYRNSSRFRERFNACPIHEPTSASNAKMHAETAMRKVIASFATRRDAEIAIEHLVQEHGVERTDIFVQPQGKANSAGTQSAGADLQRAELESGQFSARPQLNGAVEVAVDCHGAQPRIVETVLRESGAEQLRSQ
jgi:catalase